MPREVMHQGSSMAPFFRTGDRLALEPCGPEDPLPGDVIVFERAGLGLVSHRVVSVTGHGVLTRGDANRGPDPWTVPQSDILGRVVLQRGRRRTRAVPRGFSGAIEGRISACIASVVRVSRQGVSPIYRRVAKTPLFRRALLTFKQPRTLLIQRPAGEEHLLFLGQTLVAKRSAISNSWRFVRYRAVFGDHPPSW